jgi:hypothetical protein
VVTSSTAIVAVLAGVWALSVPQLQALHMLEVLSFRVGLPPTSERSAGLDG